jgi:uncharacterized protein YkwD
MRIIGTLFLIAFVATTIYFTKDDAFGLLNRVINREDKVTTIIPQSETEEATPLETTTPSSQFDREVIAPGPLKQEGFGASHEDTQTLNAIRVITATNTARKNNGVSLSLVYNAKLEQAAQVKLQDLFAKNYFEHVSPSGVSVSDLGTQAGYDYITIGENLALGDFESEQELVTAWMNSPGHRANILNTKYRDIGVAVGYGKILGQNTWVAVQHFGVSVDLCPKVSTTLRNEIAADEAVLKEQATTLEAQKRDIDESEVYERDYQDKVDAYNSGVEAYNSLVQIAKEKIIRYNNQVNAFNDCVAAQ